MTAMPLENEELSPPVRGTHEQGFETTDAVAKGADR